RCRPAPPSCTLLYVAGRARPPGCRPRRRQPRGGDTMPPTASQLVQSDAASGFGSFAHAVVGFVGQRPEALMYICPIQSASTLNVDPQRDTGRSELHANEVSGAVKGTHPDSVAFHPDMWTLSPAWTESLSQKTFPPAEAVHPGAIGCIGDVLQSFPAPTIERQSPPPKSINPLGLAPALLRSTSAALVQSVVLVSNA